SKDPAPATGGIAYLLRKYWYLALLALAAIGGLVYFLTQTDKTPQELLSQYGYWVILVWTFLEGETIVIIAGALSGTVGLKPWLIALCAFGGSFCSDQVMFSLGKYKGADVLRHFPRIARNMDKAARLFKKYDVALILGFRFVYGVRNVTPILLGISGVSHKKFFCLNLIGAGVWALAFTYGGVYVGELFLQIMHKVGHGIFYVLIGVIILVAALWFMRARRATRHAREVAGRGQAGRPGQGDPAAEADLKASDIAPEPSATSKERP
ncbi:DedA family protein, partial [Desulfovibrio sp. OttesenSCG-928-A18]|nr:DedA family protein [Desulfovibrio sp. OttesenSCG-928-A18]